MHAIATRTSAPAGQCHFSSSKNIRTALQDQQNTNWRQQAYYQCTVLAQQPTQAQQRKGALASKIPASTQCHTAATGASTPLHFPFFRSTTQHPTDEHPCIQDKWAQLKTSTRDIFSRHQ
ncbi:hypothetical protein Nepgr_010337 [Nepenthes gracilis]|uniref:Uncharacterized protein n=1 Tax=Nepenthes gracilis TaxID=150966 RepID=A0AAD3SCF7_NEPGR|nr:hypothetical protein Nepgr_010337 [Nepenthes gracilis]